MTQTLKYFLQKDKNNYPFTFSQLQAAMGTVPKMTATPVSSLMLNKNISKAVDTLAVFFSVQKFGFLDLMKNMGTLSNSSQNVSVLISDDKFVDQISRKTSNDNRGGVARVA